jgi:hypothetical protein
LLSIKRKREKEKKRKREKEKKRKREKENINGKATPKSGCFPD